MCYQPSKAYLRLIPRVHNPRVCNCDLFSMGQMRGALPSLHHSAAVRALRKIKHRTLSPVWNELSYGTGVHAPEFRDCVGTGTNRAKTDGLVREIVSLNACFQSVMKASYVMKAARHACTHNHCCILLGYGLLLIPYYYSTCMLRYHSCEVQTTLQYRSKLRW